MTLPSRADIRAKIATYLASVSGVTTAFDTTPRVVNDGQLPALIVRLGRGAYSPSPYGGGRYSATFQGQIQGLGALTNLNTEGKAELATEALLDAVMSALLNVNTFTVGTPAQAGDFLVLADSGLTAMQYPVNNETGRVYGGFILDFSIAFLVNTNGSVV